MRWQAVAPAAALAVPRLNRVMTAFEAPILSAEFSICLMVVGRPASRSHPSSSSASATFCNDSLLAIFCPYRFLPLSSAIYRRRTHNTVRRQLSEGPRTAACAMHIKRDCSGSPPSAAPEASSPPRFTKKVESASLSARYGSGQPERIAPHFDCYL
jgi:hypothetical protein